MAQKHLDLPDALMQRIEALQVLLSAGTGRKPTRSKLVDFLIHVGLDRVDQEKSPAEFFRNLAIAAKEKERLE
jgi:hypothetical protein